jgi:GntP family gluconate:H+ symporter
MLPPHPAAMLAVGAFNADIGRTLLLGLVVGLPTAALAGPIYATWIASDRFPRTIRSRISWKARATDR